jgi:dTDP-4-amino-4,6-dideoxygalactose transaminase
MSDPSSFPRIPLSEPNLAGNARTYVDDCFTTNFVSSVGPFVERFEKEFAAYVGSRFAVACATGTAAIHVGLRLLDVYQGDDVLIPSLTFIASSNPVLYERANPYFFDSEPRTWNVDPALIAEEIERRAKEGDVLPKVVQVVHILGHAAELEPLVEVCSKYDIAILEDAAESVGTRYTSGKFAGRHTGTIGKVGCFSFNGNKIMTTGGGGMIVTDDPTLARRAKHLTTQARLPGPEYQHDEIGYNYRLTNVAAALGVAQLEQMETFVAAKQKMAARYDAAFRDVPGLTLPPRQPWNRATTWLYTLLVDGARFGVDREALRKRLAAQSIEACPIWTPLHRMSLHDAYRRKGGEVAERIFRDALSIPSSTHLTEEQQARVIAEVLAARG